MKVLDLFSGIGGFSLGLSLASDEYQTIAFCEINKKCRKVLSLRWPDIPIYDDIKKLNGNEIKADVITGGYPCQPFSLSGLRRGTNDDRHLWPEMLRIIKAVRPRWIIGENVAGHISLGLDTVLSDLESENYTCWSFIIPACAVNAPHRRDRVFILANTNKVGLQQRRSFTDVGEEINKCKRVSSYDSRNYKEQADAILANDTITRHYNWWKTEPGVGRVVDGFPGRVDRLKQLGNSVVPQVVSIIGKVILEVEFPK